MQDDLAATSSTFWDVCTQRQSQMCHYRHHRADDINMSHPSATAVLEPSSTTSTFTARDHVGAIIINLWLNEEGFYINMTSPSSSTSHPARTPTTLARRHSTTSTVYTKQGSSP